MLTNQIYVINIESGLFSRKLYPKGLHYRCSCFLWQVELCVPVGQIRVPSTQSTTHYINIFFGKKIWFTSFRIQMCMRTSKWLEGPCLKQWNHLDQQKNITFWLDSHHIQSTKWSLQLWNWTGREDNLNVNLVQSSRADCTQCFQNFVIHINRLYLTLKVMPDHITPTSWHCRLRNTTGYGTEIKARLQTLESFLSLIMCYAISVIIR